MTLLPCVSLLRTTLAVLKYEYLVFNVTRALPYLNIVKYSIKEVIPYIYRLQMDRSVYPLRY